MTAAFVLFFCWKLFSLLQPNQSAWWGRWILQIFVTCGLYSWGRQPILPFLFFLILKRSIFCSALRCTSCPPSLLRVRTIMVIDCHLVRKHCDGASSDTWSRSEPYWIIFRFLTIFSYLHCPPHICSAAWAGQFFLFSSHGYLWDAEHTSTTAISIIHVLSVSRVTGSLAISPSWTLMILIFPATSVHAVSALWKSKPPFPPHFSPTFPSSSERPFRPFSRVRIPLPGVPMLRKCTTQGLLGQDNFLCLRGRPKSFYKAEEPLSC